MDAINATFLIADLVGYTALTEAHGGGEAAAIVERYRILAENATRSNVRLVETVGDQLLFVATSPHGAVRTAIDLRDALDAEPRGLGLRAGIDCGPVVERDGRFFGAAVNLTARLAAEAGSGQILCSASVAAASG